MNNESARSFDDDYVVEHYKFRPKYSDAIVSKLSDLAGNNDAKVLDIGTGLGELSYRLASHIGKIDAIDLSSKMISKAKGTVSPYRDRISWHVGKFEDIAASLDTKYDLIFGGDSLHWLDWPVSFNLFNKILEPGGYIAVIERANFPETWFRELFPHLKKFSAHKVWDDYDLIEIWVNQFGFKLIDKLKTSPVTCRLTIEEWIWTWETSAGFNPSRIGLGHIAKFRNIVTEYLSRLAVNGVVEGKIENTIAWGSL